MVRKDNLKVSENKLRIIYLLTDLLTGAVAMLLFNIFRYYFCESWHTWLTLESFLYSRSVVLEQIFLPILFLGIYALSGFYNKPVVRSRVQEFLVTLFSALIIAVIIYLGLMINDLSLRRTSHYIVVSVLFAMFFVLTYLGRMIITTRIVCLIRRCHWRFNTVIIGHSKRATRLEERLSHSQSVYGYCVVGFVEIPGERNIINDGHKLVTMDELKDIIDNYNVSQVIICPDKHREQTALKYMDMLYPLPVSIKVAADSFSYLTSSIRQHDVYDEPLLEVSSPAIDECSKNMKRLADIIISFLSLILLSLPMAVVAVCVKLDSRGPVFFVQERVGYRQRPFKIYKFRTMIKDAESSGPQLSSRNDSRVTHFGHFLRKYRIDELPQFWNVLKGEMSLVGPRPERQYYIDRIISRAPYYTLLQQVHPGITSWGMVKFGYAANVDEMVERSKYDLLYIGNMSLTVDLKILCYTIKTVISGRGI